MHSQTTAGWCSQAQCAVFIEDDELAVSVNEVGMRKAPVLPQHATGLHVDGSEKGRPEVAGRSVDHVAQPDGVFLVDARSLALPQLFHDGLAAAAAQMQDATADAISRRREQQVAWPPNRRADSKVEFPLRRDTARP